MREMYQNQSNSALGAKTTISPKVSTVTEQLRDSRDSLQKLNARMEDLITRTGVNVINEIKTATNLSDHPQAADTRSVTIDIADLCKRLHRKMDTLDNIA